jgi:hypothetical protein
VSETAGTLTTVAGISAPGPGGDGGPATAAGLHFACGTATDRYGNLLFAERYRVRVVAARTGTFYGQPMLAGHIYTVAGQADSNRGPTSQGPLGPTGDGGPATKANLFDATGVSVDRAGNLLIADSGELENCDYCTLIGALVRVVAARTGTFYGQSMTAGDIYTVAGVPEGGTEGNGQVATRTWLGPLEGSVQADPYGNLVVADNAGQGNGAGGQNTDIAPSVRVVAATTGTFYGQKMTAGHIYRVAGNTNYGQTGDGGPATRAALALAGDVAVDAAGNLLIADWDRVRVVAARTGTFYGQDMTAGHIYGIAGTGRPGYSGDGGPATLARVQVHQVGLDGFGNLVLDGSGRVRVVAGSSGRFYGQPMTAGRIYTVAGNGTEFSGQGWPVTRAVIPPSFGVSQDQAGDLAIASDDGLINASDQHGNFVAVVMARSGTYFGQRMRAGHLYVVAGPSASGRLGDGGPGRQASLDLGDDQTATAFDRSGNLLVADNGDNRVRLVAVRSGRFYGQAMTAGDIYTIAGNGRQGKVGNGGPAVDASLSKPSAVAVDSHGNVFIVDQGNYRVRVVAARTGTFYGQARTAGDIYLVAGDGGLGTRAGVYPVGVAVDGAGNLLITDFNNRVRLVAARTGTFYGQAMTAGHIYTIAKPQGLGQFGCKPTVRSCFSFFQGITVDRHGNVIFVAYYTAPAGDSNQEGIVVVRAARTGTFYGRAMTAGHLYWVAGGGRTILGDGGPALAAQLCNPTSVSVAPTGALVLADTCDSRIRSITP